MLAMRRVAFAAPARARNCAFLTKMKAMKGETDALAAKLPDGLKEIATSGAEIHADLTDFATKRPELFKAVLAKIEAADKPGIVATAAAARNPTTCKYTEEGTLLHEMMARVYKSDRRMAALADLEVTLTAGDKKMIEDSILAKAAEKGLKAPKFDFPDKIEVSKML